MKNLRRFLVGVIVALIAMPGFAQTATEWKALKGDIVLYMANDLGRNGYYDQKTIAELMGRMAEEVGPECVIAAGDVHHFEGVRSINDPLWMTNYELIYSHPELMIDWFPVLGNHEYRGNTQAVLDYANVSRRWSMPARYYTKVFNEDGTTVRIVFLDTTPLIDKYRTESDKYSDACKQDMQKRVDTILRKYNNVTIYACGHIHNFQHIRIAGSAIDYVVNSSASLSRKVEPIESTVFCSPEPGFSIFSIDKNVLRMYLIDKNGKVLHTITRTK